MIMTAVVTKSKLGVEHSSGVLYYFLFLPHLDDVLEW